MRKLLLDTHTLLWVIGQSNNLSLRVIELVADRHNEVFVSAVSFWEIALKHSIGKLELDFDVKGIPLYCSQMGFSLLPLEPVEALGCLNLPFKADHKDPFDRMLIYQCICNQYTLVSKDGKMRLYAEEGLNIVW